MYPGYPDTLYLHCHHAVQVQCSRSAAATIAATSVTVRPDLGIDGGHRVHGGVPHVLDVASHGEVGRHCRFDAAGAALALHGRVEQLHVGRVGAVRREDWVYLDVDAGVRRHAGAPDVDDVRRGRAARPVTDLADAAVLQLGGGGCDVVVGPGEEGLGGRRGQGGREGGNKLTVSF